MSDRGEAAYSQNIVKMETKGGPGGSGCDVGCGVRFGSPLGRILGAKGGQMGPKWEPKGGQMATNIALNVGADLEVHCGGLPGRNVGLL